MVENTASTPAKAHSAVAAPLSLPPPPSVTRFLHPFYLINAALILCYQLVRNYHHTYGATAYSKYLGDASLSYWETQAFTGLGIVGVFRYFFLFNSPDGFASSMFFYAKVIITSLAFVVDSRLAAWYALAAVTGHLLLPQPRVEPLPQLVTDLTAAALKERVLVSGNKVSWLVMFTTPWSSSCTAYAPVLADLAGRYASDTMAFGTLDVGVWGGVAKQLGIDINASSTQLPTWVLFEGGTELGRFPRAENATKKYAYSRKDLTKYFMLDDAESRRAGGNAGSGSVGSGSNKKKK